MNRSHQARERNHLSFGERESQSHLGDDLEFETALGGVCIDRDRAPDDFVYSRLEWWNANNERSSVAWVEPLVTAINLLTSFVKDLEFTESSFELLGEPDPYLSRRAAHFATDPGTRVIEKGVRLDCRCELDAEQKRQ